DAEEDERRKDQQHQQELQGAGVAAEEIKHRKVTRCENARRGAPSNRIRWRMSPPKCNKGEPRFAFGLLCRAILADRRSALTGWAIDPGGGC
ncbi:MAG: hypothetical protein ABI809_08715, partial [Caldimonas sp.]